MIRALSRKEAGMPFPRRQLLRTVSVAFGSSFLLGRNQLGIAAQAATQPKLSPPPAGAAVRDGIAGGTEMEKVTGIGGFFFRAKDPKALGLWYQQHLGVSLLPSSQGESPWQQEAGPTAFAPFPEASKYFGDAQKVWMLNFRVRDLEKMAAQLQAAGIEIKLYPPDPTGRFARVHDPREIRSNCGSLQSQPLHASLAKQSRTVSGFLPGHGLPEVIPREGLAT